MKYSFFSAVIVVFALAVQPVSADLVSFDFASQPSASMQFIGTGNQILFPSTTTYDFSITNATSPLLGGLQGNIGGTFVVGAITTTGPLETAPITSTAGVFSVYDGLGNTLTADLDWSDIFVYSNLFGGLNILGAANLSNFSYSGANSDLLAIANGTDQTVVLSFQFSPLAKQSLAHLMEDGLVHSTSYSGSMSAVPEPSSCVLLGMAALGLLAYVRRRS